MDGYILSFSCRRFWLQRLPGCVCSTRSRSLIVRAGCNLHAQQHNIHSVYNATNSVIVMYFQCNVQYAL